MAEQDFDLPLSVLYSDKRGKQWITNPITGITYYSFWDLWKDEIIFAKLDNNLILPLPKELLCQSCARCEICSSLNPD